MLFETVALDGGASEPSPRQAQVTGDFHPAPIGDSRSGKILREFLLGPEPGAIYRYHGPPRAAG